MEKKIEKKCTSTIAPLPFPHKLNYFSFCRTFEILFIICAKILLLFVPIF